MSTTTDDINDSSGNTTITDDEATRIIQSMILGETGVVNSYPNPFVNRIENMFTMPLRDGFMNRIVHHPSTQGSVPIFTPASPVAGTGSSGVDLAWFTFLGQLVDGTLGTGQSRGLRDLIQRSMEDEKAYKNVLSQKGCDQIKKAHYDPEVHKETTTCPITRNEFTKETSVGELPCGHIFEHDAIMLWLKNESASCPVCRSKLDSVEERVEKKGVRVPTAAMRAASSPSRIRRSPPPGRLVDASNANQLDGSGNRTDYSELVREISDLIHPFGPQTSLRRTPHRHMMNLMQARIELDEERALQEAIMASLHNQTDEKILDAEVSDPDELD